MLKKVTIAILILCLYDLPFTLPSTEIHACSEVRGDLFYWWAILRRITQGSPFIKVNQHIMHVLFTLYHRLAVWSSGLSSPYLGWCHWIINTAQALAHHAHRPHRINSRPSRQSLRSSCNHTHSRSTHYKIMALMLIDNLAWTFSVSVAPSNPEMTPSLTVTNRLPSTYLHM